jgi:signal transduction histidine kinase
LHENVRAGIEFLALEDKGQEIERDEKRAREATRELRSSLRKAIEEVERNPSLPRSEKNSIVETYSRLSKEIDDVDEYHRTTKQNLELISLLGVLSGFMTHETEKIITELKAVSKELDELAKKYPQLSAKSERIKSSLLELEGQIGYTGQFIRSIHNARPVPFSARSQVEYIIEKFGSVAARRGIEHIIEIDEFVKSPVIHVAIYSGVFLNLYTNALKAIMMKDASTSEGKILIRAFNTSEKHILEVFDNGIGIPDSLRDRIWDPLFSTTSRLNSPLGTGMGLGLSLVKKVLAEIGGSVRIVDPVKDYVTVFRVEYPLRILPRR